MSLNNLEDNEIFSVFLGDKWMNHRNPDNEQSGGILVVLKSALEKNMNATLRLDWTDVLFGLRPPGQSVDAP
jgi:hypothetical protein